MPPKVEARILNHWTTREIPGSWLFERTFSKMKIFRDVVYQNQKDFLNDNCPKDILLYCLLKVYSFAFYIEVLIYLELLWEK